MEEEHAAETELPTLNGEGDEFVENATKLHYESKDHDQINDTEPPSHIHNKWLWLHAAFHCLVTMVVSVTQMNYARRDNEVCSPF